MAQHVNVITDKLISYINTQISSLSQNNPLIAITKPLISRMLDNNIYKFESVLKQIADKDGLIDTEGILSEMIDNIVNSQSFKINTNFLGELEIGCGKIKMNLPLINKTLVLNQEDLIKFKDAINN